jgi:hypothetical protein
MGLQRRASVHHVRARTPRFASGGDDYLFISLVGGCKVRAIASPATPLAGVAAAIIALLCRSAALSCVHMRMLGLALDSCLHACSLCVLRGPAWCLGRIRQVLFSSTYFWRGLCVAVVKVCQTLTRVSCLLGPNDRWTC